MTSRERVQCLLAGRVPDRIPNGLGACETSGLHVLAYDKLQAILGLPPEPPRIDTFMLNAVFEKDMLKAIGGDMILLASPNMCHSSLWGEGYEDEWKQQRLWGKTFRVPVREQFTERADGSVVWDTAGTVCLPGTIFFDSENEEPFNMDFDIPSPDKYKPRGDLPEKMLRALEETAKNLYESTDLSICCGEAITDLQIAPAGFLGTMILLKHEPGIMHEFLGKACESGLSQLNLLDQAIGRYTDVLCVAHDFGDNRGVTIGENLWREIYKPHYMKLFQGWKKTTRMKINLHSCGSVAGILPDLIECGMDIYNPVQTSANGMDAEILKEKYGDKLIFYGGAYDAQSIPIDANYQEVYDLVTRNIDIFKRNGRYIFAGIHNLPGNMPCAHLSAMINAFQDNKWLA